jgi:hypothetical protein
MRERAIKRDTLTAAQGWAEVRRAHQRDLEYAMENLKVFTLKLLDEGMSESGAAKVAGVDRMTVRRWRGKL